MKAAMMTYTGFKPVTSLSKSFFLRRPTNDQPMAAKVAKKEVLDGSSLFLFDIVLPYNGFNCADANSAKPCGVTCYGFQTGPKRWQQLRILCLFFSEKQRQNNRKLPYQIRVSKLLTLRQTPSVLVLKSVFSLAYLGSLIVLPLSISKLICKKMSLLRLFYLHICIQNTVSAYMPALLHALHLLQRHLFTPSVAGCYCQFLMR